MQLRSIQWKTPFKKPARTSGACPTLLGFFPSLCLAIPLGAVPFMRLQSENGVLANLLARWCAAINVKLNKVSRDGRAVDDESVNPKGAEHGLHRQLHCERLGQIDQIGRASCRERGEI